MVLFYEDRPASVPRPPSKWRKYIRRLIKTILVLALLIGASLWVMSSLGGNKNALRLGVQDYLSEATGFIADMATLHNMSFFPVAGIIFEDLSFHRPVEKVEPQPKQDQQQSFPPQHSMTDFFDSGELVARVDSMEVTMGFWDMFFERRRFRTLDIKGVTVNDDIWLPEPLTVASIAVTSDNKPEIVGTGTYGIHKYDFHFGITRETNKAGITFYNIEEETPLTVSLGPLSLEGVLQPADKGYSALEIKKAIVGKAEITGTLSYKGNIDKRIVKADLKTGQSHLLADLTVTPLEVTGTVTFPRLDIRDIKTIRKIDSDIRMTLGITSQDDKISFGTRTMDINLIIQKLVHDKSEWGMAKADINVKPYTLNIGGITGLINGGALTGDLTIDATTEKPILKTQGHLRGWDYARLQSEVTGQADTHLALTSEATTFADLEKNLKGEITTIAGKGELTQDTMLYWGGGLINAMLPSLSGSDRLKMNCMVADFNVNGTRADAKTFFMDLSDLTVVGEGSINLDKMTLDLELEPHPKEVSILDSGIAVDVTGPLSAPRIQPDGLSITKKIGELFLGTINPVFFALSLTDLGLNESHPCHAYLKKP